MVAPQAVDEILSAITAGITSKEPAAGKSTDKLQALANFENEVVFVDAGYAIIDGIALIEISGGLTYRAYSWWTTSYLDIRDSFRAAMADERAEGILFLIDSPGGEVAGLFDLVDEIYHARGTKPIIAVADEAAFSAAYTIASAADEVYLPTTAQVGSIGVIAIHIDQSGYDKNLGLHYTAIFAGDHKNDYNPHETLKADGKEVLQAHVDKIYDLLTATVARNRCMKQAAVIATQAGFYMGDDAVAAGLADGILSARDIMTKMSSSKGDMTMNFNEVKDFITHALAESMSEVKKMLEEQCHVLEGIEARLIEPAPVVDPPDTADPGAVTPTAGAGDIVEICDVAGMPELAGPMIRDGLTLDEAKSAILDAKAKAAAQTPIISTIGPLASSESNPLLADAKKRAEKQGAGMRAQGAGNR
jgi:signal peptide peptidase SppA